MSGMNPPCCTPSLTKASEIYSIGCVNVTHQAPILPSMTYIASRERSQQVTERTCLSHSGVIEGERLLWVDRSPPQSFAGLEDR